MTKSWSCTETWKSANHFKSSHNLEKVLVAIISSLALPWDDPSWRKLTVLDLYVYSIDVPGTQMGPLVFYWKKGLVLEGFFSPKNRGQTRKWQLGGSTNSPLQALSKPLQGPIPEGKWMPQCIIPLAYSSYVVTQILVDLVFYTTVKKHKTNHAHHASWAYSKRTSPINGKWLLFFFRWLCLFLVRSFWLSVTRVLFSPVLKYFLQIFPMQTFYFRTWYSFYIGARKSKLLFSILGCFIGILVMCLI